MLPGLAELKSGEPLRSTDWFDPDAPMTMDGNCAPHSDSAGAMVRACLERLTVTGVFVARIWPHPLGSMLTVTGVFVARTWPHPLGSMSTAHRLPQQVGRDCMGSTQDPRQHVLGWQQKLVQLLL